MFGLIGKDISHSFSKKIHHKFGNNNYGLYNIDDLNEFINNLSLSGFNVTMPYKTKIIPYMYQLDDISRATQSVNTVVKIDDQLYGYNTDYYGFSELMKKNNINVKNKKVLILGNGSVAKTIAYYLDNHQVKTYVKLVRNLKEDKEDLLHNASNYSDYDIIINTTPVGMYPNNEDELIIDIESFRNLEAVVDLIYNPLKTKLLIEAETKNIKSVNGLTMLVMQAKKAHEIFFNQEISSILTKDIYIELVNELINIVFIGLPLSGKSKYARIFSQIINKKLFDTDEEIEKKIEMTIPKYFQFNSEKEFRIIEQKIVRNIYKNNNAIISTGGGIIKRQINIDLLKQNGLIIFLNKDPEDIAKKSISGRPLIKKSEDILKLAKERLPLYIKYSDIIIDINKDTEYHIKELKEKIDEYISNQWSKY